MNAPATGLRTNYILVDYENVQPTLIPRSNGFPVKVLIFVGPKQARMPLSLVRSVQPLGDDARYIQVEAGGRNALDFCIAYWIGVLAGADSNAFFYIVSNDADYDPLLRHLKRQNILGRRVGRLSEIPTLVSSVEEKAMVVADRMRGLAHQRPSRLKALRNAIQAIYLKALSDEEVQSVICELESRGVITIKGEEVSHHPPASEGSRASRASDAKAVSLPA